MKLSVIIPVHNQWEYTKQCIGMLRTNNPKFDGELIFINNASIDNTGNYLSNELGYKNTWVLDCPHNTGMARSWNMGASIARGDLLCFLNNDVLLPKEFFKTILDGFEKNPDVSCISPDYVSGYVHKIKPCDWMVDQVTPKKTELKRKIDVDYRMKGFCFFVKKSVWQDLGGFDERYGIGWHEDVDFNMRMVLKGYITARMTGCTIYHHESKTLFNIPDYKKHLERSNEKFQEKWKGQNLEEIFKKL